MANEIKAEFETYVQQLTETICKEIYLEDLKNLCNTYAEQLEECKTLYVEHTESNKELQNQNAEHLEKLTSIGKVLEENLQSIQDKMLSFENEYERILKEYSTKVYEINDEMRETFLNKFSDVMNSSREELAKELNLCNQNITKSLEASLTDEGIQKFIDQMEASTIKISEGLDLIHGGYREIFEQYSAKVSAYGDMEQERFQNIIENTTKEGIDYFKKCVDKAIEEQKHMLEDNVAGSQDIQSLKQEITVLSTDMKKMQETYEDKFNLMIQILNKNEKEKLNMERDRQTEKKYLFYLVISDIVLLFFTGISLLSASPWAVLGTVPTIIALVVLVAIVLYMVMFKNKTELPSGEINKKETKEE